ncbi:MAG TPA: winged helix-turn-helix transcriptional regulator [Solirubrobacterales bacterium]|nr:winged helix-turn-helix transcriptional regulator [Solirubrobacterales bacterium]
MLAHPLNVSILRSLTTGPKQGSELRRETGFPAQTTIRAQLKQLAGIGAVEKHRKNHFPGVLTYELTATGRGLLSVAEILEDWLQAAPHSSLRLGDAAAKAAIKALIEAWATSMLRALGARPLSLTALDRVIASQSYPALERRLSALRVTGMVEPQPTNGAGTPYAANAWLRRGVAPLVAAARWERKHASHDMPALTRGDVETTFLLAAPLLRLPSGLSGSCRVAAIASDRDDRPAGAMIEIADGTVTACSTQLNGDVNCWVVGSISAWLNALVVHDLDGLELGGDSDLARELVGGLHRELYGAPRARREPQRKDPLSG